MPAFSDQENPAAFSDSKLTKLLTCSYLAAFNVQLLLLPITLSYDWQLGSIPLIESIFDLRNALTTLLCITLTLLSMKLLKIIFMADADEKEEDQLENRSFCLGLCLLIFPYIPASNLFFTVGFVVAERVLYLPSMGFIILLLCGLRRLNRNSLIEYDPSWRRLRKKWYFYLKNGLFLITIVFALKTLDRNQVWQSREKLFE